MAQVIERVRATKLPIELIIVDDGSTDVLTRILGRTA